MIKLSTPNLPIYDYEWGTPEEENNSEESILSTEYLSPSDETIAKLKSFARSVVVDLSKDPNYTFPTA